MINKTTAQVLSSRLPLALLQLSPDIIDMLEYKWGDHDGMFHSVKATTKKFSKFKDVDITKYENVALGVIDEVLTGIYGCPNCHTDLRKCGVMRRTNGVEIVELYIAEDGRQSRTHHERFESSGGQSYQCLACHNNIQNGHAVNEFLKRGISKGVCVDYLHRHHPAIIKKAMKDMDGGFDRPRPMAVPDMMPIDVFQQPQQIIARDEVERREMLELIQRQNRERNGGGGGGVLNEEVLNRFARDAVIRQPEEVNE